LGLIRITERWRGTRGGFYVYVVEGDKLIHISNYAKRTLPGKWEDEVMYEVSGDVLKDKVLYCFDYSRKGGAFLIKCNINDFVDGELKRYDYLESLNKRVQEIRNLEFFVKNRKLLSLMSQFKQVFIPMVEEIKSYEKVKGFKLSFRGHQARLEEVFRDPILYYFTSMSLPRDRSRVTSLKIVRRWIYQLWVLKLLCEALNVSRFKGHEFRGIPRWYIEQGSAFSTAIAETPFGDVTFWIEFQPGVAAHMIGMFIGRRIPIRPDIVAVRGHFLTTDDFLDSGKPIDLLIECKEGPFDTWREDIQKQIIPYKEIFKPNNLILVSLEYVPTNVKSELDSLGIKVIDNLRPRGKNIEIFRDIIREVFR